jgi:hypothetical protein
MTAKKVDPASIVSCATFPDTQEAFHLLIEGSGTETPLAACMLGMHFVTYEDYKTHNAKSVGSVYVPYTDDQMLNWSTKGHIEAIPELVSRLTDLKTILIQLRARLPKTSASDQEVYENTKKLLIEAAHDTLVNALINVTAGQEGFKTMANLPAYKAHKRVWNSIPEAITIEYFKHPFQVMLVAFAEMFARKMTSSTVKHTSLNTLPDVEKESLDDYAKLMDDVCETILNKQMPSIPALVDHLRTTQMIMYINTGADNKNLRTEYRSIFKTSRVSITTDVATDARPIDGLRWTVHKLNLDTALIAAGYQEIAPPLSEVHIRAMAALTTTGTTTRPPRRRANAKAGARGPCSYTSSLLPLQQNGAYTAKLPPNTDAGIYGARYQT